MLLPTPTPDEVIRFQAIYKEQYGQDLPAREALPLLTRLTQFYYLTGGHDARRQRLQGQRPVVSSTGDAKRTPATRKPSVC